MLNVRRTRGWAHCKLPRLAGDGRGECRGCQRRPKFRQGTEARSAKGDRQPEFGSLGETNFERCAVGATRSASFVKRTKRRSLNKLEKRPRTSKRMGSTGGHLGVSITTDKDENGVLVVQIRPNTAAQKMGLQRHDRITELNGEKVQSADGFISDISSMNPGDQVELKVVRNGNERTIQGRTRRLFGIGRRNARSERHA